MATYDIDGYNTSADKFEYLLDWAKSGSLAELNLSRIFNLAVFASMSGGLSYSSVDIFDEMVLDDQDHLNLLNVIFLRAYAYVEPSSLRITRKMRPNAESEQTSESISKLIRSDVDVKKTFLKMLYHASINQTLDVFFQKDPAVAIGDIEEDDLSELISILDEKISESQEALGQKGTGTRGLIAAEAVGSAGATVAVISANAAAALAGTNEEVIEKSFAEEDLRNFLQCALLKDFVNTYDNNEDGNFGYIKSTETYNYTKVPYKGRVIPLKMNDPGLFLNLCNFPKDMKLAFVRKSRMSNASIIPSFKYMRPITSDTDDNYIVGHEEINLELNQRTADVTFSNLTIDFDGTNPSTARKDVKVKIELKLKNLGCLDYNIAKKNEEYLFELYKLITVPYGVQQDSSVGGSLIRNQYSPDYNRIRMTLNSKMTSKIDDEEVEFKKYQTFDLAMESHEINRANDAVTMTLNYRGYFQSLLSHPFMDALATAGVMKERIEADKELSKLGNSCSPETIKEIIRINRMADLQNAKNHSWNKFINNVNDNTAMQWMKYTSKTEDLRAFTFTNNLDYSSRGSKLCTWNDGTRADADQILTKLVEAQENMTDKKVRKTDDGFSLISSGDENAILKGTKITSAFTTVGSIMQVALESLYKDDDSVDLHPKFEHLNLKFLVAPIEISNPQNPSEKINFNPLELPVDLLFFNQWFQSTIINKGLTYYPVLTMIRDLIERLVNSLLLEMCFDNSQPDELPPLLRVGFFNDNRGDYIFPTNDYAFDFGFTSVGPGLGRFDDLVGGSRLFEHDPESENPLNTYCVIYSQNRGSYITPSDLKNYTSSPYIPIFQHGHKLTDADGNSGGDSALSNVSFSKENMTGLKEARFFSSGGGGLNVLSNVYNLGFDLNKLGANVFIYPGQIIQFNLMDFDDYNDDWERPDALSSIMGFGGFYVIKKTSITIKTLAGADFTIHYDALWSGNGAGVEFRKSNDKNKIIEANTLCEAAFKKARTRYTTAGGTGQIETSVEAPRTTTNPTQSGTRYYSQSGPIDRAVVSIAEENIENAITQYKIDVTRKNEYKQTGYSIPYKDNSSGRPLSGREATMIIKGVYQPNDNVQQIKVGVVDKETGIEAEYQVNIKNGAAEYIKISR